MDIRQEKLRMKFKAETDKEVTSDTISDYADWLEMMSAEELNKVIIMENEHLKRVVQKAIDILDDGITDKCIEI